MLTSLHDHRVAPAATADIPLCVDLDGTLIRSDLLVEGLLAMGTDWRHWPLLARLLSGSRAALKQRVSHAVPIDPALLPYNEALLAYLREQKRRGRTLVLATAADEVSARAVAEHLGLFDAVLASDGVRNLKGAHKAEAISAHFGGQPFAYAGDARIDLTVWAVAQKAVVVNASPAVLAAARRATTIEAEIDDRPPLPRAALRAMRPHQWVKNLLVFVPIFTAHALGDLSAWLGALAMFGAFCAMASSIYLVNDLSDLPSDRRHPRKRNRPFASGALPIPHGLALAAVLFVAGVVLAALAGAPGVVLVYAAMSVGYSLQLKEKPLVDVFMLAALYTIRLYGGGEATGYNLSLWLLGYSGFMFLSLALVKRVEEVNAVARQPDRVMGRRGYGPTDAPILQAFGCGAAFASSLVLALFVQAEAVAGRYASPILLWGTVPLLLFWQCRLWLATARGQMHDDPIVFAARDRVSWLVAVMAVVLLTAAKSGLP